MPDTQSGAANGDKQNEKYNILVGALCLIGFVALFAVLTYEMSVTTQPMVRLPLLVIVGVMALFATLALVAVTFSLAGLDDATQPLGLPEGSVRAAIALSLILIFAIISIYFYTSIANLPCSTCSASTEKPANSNTAATNQQSPSTDQTKNSVGQTAPKATPTANPATPTSTSSPANQQTNAANETPSESNSKDSTKTPTPSNVADNRTAATDFAKQVFAVVGTLMTSVASFYFASRTAATSNTSSAPPPNAPNPAPAPGPAPAPKTDGNAVGGQTEVKKQGT